MRLLQRASELLSHLAADPGLSLDELSEVTAIPRASCGRLLNALTRLAWAEYRDRGWHLGPRAQAMADGAPYRGRLLEIARPYLAAASRTLGQPVALSVLRGDKRLVLERVWPNGRRDRRLEVGEEDLVYSLAGRLLIAMQPPTKRRRLCALLNLPDPVRWPGCINERELRANLSELARSRYLVAITRGLAATTVVLRDGDGGWATLGTFAQLPGHPQALRHLRNMREKIEQEMDVLSVPEKECRNPAGRGRKKSVHKSEK